MTDTLDKADLLAQLSAATQRRKALDRQREEVFREEVALVAALRELTTWQVIADTVGRAKQNTITTYRPHLEETRTRTVRVRAPKEKP
ncbi:hypothetical protein ABT336_11960 [Micromonospora sp. NPDC000207]|uniref:hypothetical protein n=1 Tax=Micromonospora sp. NPDC000207 TaxID=3154246 RepID=UPI00331AF3CD